MTDDTSAADRLAAHRANLSAAGAIPMTVEEILGGQSQAGVPRPAFLKDHDDDGTVQRVGGAAGGEDGTE
jgi:hypothetical protein